MPRAREWADEFEQGIKAYGFSEEQIQRYKDADSSIMYNVFYDVLEDKIRQNAFEGRRTFLLCFYAGLGASDDNETYALLNSNRRGCCLD